MTLAPMPIPKVQFFDNTGLPLAGGYLYTSQAGAPSIPKATYTDSTGVTPNANPTVLDSSGRASIWLNGFYYMELWTGDNTLPGSQLIWTTDNVSSVSVFSPPDFPGVDASLYQDLPAAITAIGATVTNLVVSTHTNCPSNTTVPANVNLICLNTGLIIISNTKTLTVNGPSQNLSTSGSGNVILNGTAFFEYNTLDHAGTVTVNGSFTAGSYRVFTGGGTVTFGAGSLRMYEPGWSSGVFTLPAIFQNGGFALKDLINGKIYNITVQNGLLTLVEL